ncbi:hypothetical protein QZH41_020458 [Actinostola sp. cb2023]|nr:hypothetical protein QZH41_020458 [Actinostola sp. cb2023]
MKFRRFGVANAIFKDKIVTNVIASKELSPNSTWKNTAISVARNIFKELGPAFNKWAGMPLEEALSKVPEANISAKMSWKQTVICKSSERERLSSSHESNKSAQERRYKVLAQEQAGSRKPKDHSGNFDKMLNGIDKASLKNEVKCYPEGTTVNWSDLARRYSI